MSEEYTSLCKTQPALSPNNERGFVNRVMLRHTPFRLNRIHHGEEKNTQMKDCKLISGECVATQHRLQEKKESAKLKS